MKSEKEISFGYGNEILGPACPVTLISEISLPARVNFGKFTNSVTQSAAALMKKDLI
jgi:hypothetical protein